MDESADSDADTVGDCTDNCVNAYNPDQANADGDAYGDVCDCTPDDESNPPPPPLGSGEVVHVNPESGESSRVWWASDESGYTYNFYRGWFVAGDAWSDNHQCPENRSSDKQAVDAVTPRPGVLYSYVVSRFRGSHSESNCDDNCPATVNSDQTDIDGDGIGDACDPEFAE